MAQSETALIEAQDYARECIERGREFARVVRVRAVVNGYDYGHGKCEEFYGYAVETENAMGTDSLVIMHNEEIPTAEKALYIIDDGATVTARYVAGWNVSQRAVYLQPFPVERDSNGEAIRRAHDGRTVDYSSWLLSARKAYHVKLSRDLD